MSFATGSLVRARGREWVVLPERAEEVVMLRPLGGSEDEVTGIDPQLENIEPAQFAPPDPCCCGDHQSGRLLRESVRLGFRSSSGPFRSFARLAVEPRPYQLVPLLMALRSPTVRLMIADDVGIGKTVEACLIAREMLDRGEVQRMAVLCPPHLAEQWQAELRDKFQIEAVLVLSGTARRLEQNCALNQSLFELYPYVIVSLDFIKSERHRSEFLRTCPDLVIVDEAHTCAYGGGYRSGRHQRHELLNHLAQDQERHLVLVTATPHSGNEEAFRSLLKLLNPSFAELPEDLSGAHNEAVRREVARHLVQRRRGDILSYLDTRTQFPDAELRDLDYTLTSEYKLLTGQVIEYCRESVATSEGNRQRVRWWSALALLRALASSPAAAVATLRNRAAAAQAQSAEEIDDLSRRMVLDLEDDNTAERLDNAPGSSPEDGDDAEHRRLALLAQQAEKLFGPLDTKLQLATREIKNLLKQGFAPIVFCRFIPTAEYLADHLRQALGKTEVSAVTGLLPPVEREERVRQLAESPQRVLVCTDCLSEGINLQDHFNAVVHYDLSWNPTRHEQRNGRVDRFGQPAETVRMLTLFGKDNGIDGIVLDVLLNKHKAIRNSLGISVAVPGNTEQLIEAVFEGLLLRQDNTRVVEQEAFWQEAYGPEIEAMHQQWDAAVEREKRSRTMFAQQTIKVEEVGAELASVRAALGGESDLAQFVHTAITAHGGVVSPQRKGVWELDVSAVPRALHDMLGFRDRYLVRYDLPVPAGVEHLTRTHPLVAALAGYVMDSALDNQSSAIAKRCGVIRTAAVDSRTTVLVVRIRYHLTTIQDKQSTPTLVEDCLVRAFRGSASAPEWLPDETAQALLEAQPDRNISSDQAAEFVRRVLAESPTIHRDLEQLALQCAETLLESHQRLRRSAQLRGRSYQVEPRLPVDLLGVYIYLPNAGGAR